MCMELQRAYLVHRLKHENTTSHLMVTSSFCKLQTSAQKPSHSALRANPFPKVTDQFCRLPLPTLFCSPEAVNLGDLMRLCVRSGVQVRLHIWRFMDRQEHIKHPSNLGTLLTHKTLAPGNLISGQPVMKRNRKHFPRNPPVLPNKLMLPPSAHILAEEC